MSDLQKNETDPGHEEPEVDVVRRRLLRIVAYAAPFIVTLGLPESSSAGPTHCPTACRCGNACGHP